MINNKEMLNTLLEANIVIGKDILEILTNAMYIDPLTVYREYVQNSADSIDVAIRTGLLIDNPNIMIKLDHVERKIIIRDNGIGIQNSEFVNRITSIGASNKRGKNLRGFRGVGRLAGLGYCQELIFRGKAEGDEQIFEVRWSSRALKEKMLNVNFSGNLNTIIGEIITYTDTPTDNKAERFFEVEMRKVARLKNDILMNEQAIRMYLSQVAPVPFHPDFSFGSSIQTFLTEKGVQPPIRIELNDNLGPIYHRMQNCIEINTNTKDTIKDINFIEIKESDNELAAFGWVAEHNYLGAVPKRQGLGGIRLRIGNIQIGDESLLAELYPEQRFSNWTIGDIHVCSKKIIPNARRDNFEHTVHYSWFQSELSTFVTNLAYKIRTQSQQRQILRNTQITFKSINDWFSLATKQDTPVLLKKALLELTQEHVIKAEKEICKFEKNAVEHQLASTYLQDILGKIHNLGIEISDIGNPVSNKFTDATENALLKALKVVLSNSRTVQMGAKTAFEIVAAVSNSH